MGITGLITIIILIMLIITVRFVVSGIKQRNWKRVIISVVGFVVLIAGIYWALVSLITSM